MADDADLIVISWESDHRDGNRRRQQTRVVEREEEQGLGGQALWFGDLFLSTSSEQRLLGIKNRYDLALQDWMAQSASTRNKDLWGASP